MCGRSLFFLSELLGIDLGVLEAEEVEDAVQADAGDGLAGAGTDLGLRVIRDAEAREPQHRQVVGTVTDGYGLLEVDVLHLA